MLLIQKSINKLKKILKQFIESPKIKMPQMHYPTMESKKFWEKELEIPKDLEPLLRTPFEQSAYQTGVIRGETQEYLRHSKKARERAKAMEKWNKEIGF